MTPEMYDNLRMAMFGQRSLSDWSDEELEDPDCFVEWAIEQGGIPKSMRAELMEVFNNEVAEYREKMNED